MNREIIFLYNIEREKEKQIRMLCRAFETEVKKIKPEQAKESIGSLMGLEVNVEKTEDIIPDEEMMLICGFSGMKLEAFLEGYKLKEIDPIKLKAVVTEHNILWSISYLYKELKNETEWEEKA
ncbi:MAG: DUF3783 domain-containing protein [Eubacterium sp.]|nr:DUF3783 domain-containing protein [Eubacterium sp.]